MDAYQPDELSPNASQVREESFVAAGKHNTISRTPSLKYPLLNYLPTISEVRGILLKLTGSLKLSHYYQMYCLRENLHRFWKKCLDSV
jgi:hypothetical protein